MPQKLWALGEEVLATDFNNYVQNQVVPTFPTVAARDAWANPPRGSLCVTTDTDTVWRYMLVGAALAWSRLWANPPSFRVVGGVGQSVAPNVPANCAWTTEVYDALNLVSNGLFVCPAGWDGRWQFEYSVRFPGPSTGVRNVWIGAGLPRYAQQTLQQTATGDTMLAGSASVVLAANASVAIGVFHTHTGGFLINASPDDYFQGRWISAFNG